MECRYFIKNKWNINKYVLLKHFYKEINITTQYDEYEEHDDDIGCEYLYPFLYVEGSAIQFDKIYENTLKNERNCLIKSLKKIDI